MKKLLHTIFAILGWPALFLAQDNSLLMPDTLEAVVVTASRKPEKITQAPAPIQLIDQKNLERFAGSNPGELLSYIQGIEFTRAGVDGITFNSRGYNTAFNNKVLQIIDGRTATAPMSGSLPFFNNGTTIKEDIKQWEIVLGPQTALHGPNAQNVVFNTLTKDPRSYPGTTISFGIGNQKQFSSRFRHAQVLNDKWAFKVTGEHATGREFEFIDTIYTPVSQIPELEVDFNFRHLRGEAHVFYSLNSKTDVVLSAGGSSNDFPQVTSAGRNQFRGFGFGFIQGRLVHPRYFINVYNTWGSLGHSYAIAGYSIRLNSLLNMGRPLHEARKQAYEQVRIREISERTNAEIQYNNHITSAGLSFIASIDFQQQRPNGFGITLVDKDQRIQLNQLGGALQVEKELPWQMRLIGALRFDHHDKLGNFLAPKLAVAKKIGEGHLRLGWAKAYAMPTLQQQYASINNSYFGNGGNGVLFIPNNTSIHDPSTYQMTDPLKPERVSSVEFGYIGQISKSFSFDVNSFYAHSHDFISTAITMPGRVISVDNISVTHNPQFAGSVDENGILSNASFTTNVNFAKVRTWGLDAGMTWVFHPNIKLAMNYTWLDSDIGEGKPENDMNNDGVISGEERSLNAPNHRGTARLIFHDLFQGKWYGMLGVRAVQQYDFHSGSQIGTKAGKGSRGMIPGGTDGSGFIKKNFDWGPLGGFTTVDLMVGFRLREQVSLNLNITNLFNTRQIEFVGSPSIGRLMMGEIRIDL